MRMVSFSYEFGMGPSWVLITARSARRSIAAEPEDSMISTWSIEPSRWMVNATFTLPASSGRIWRAQVAQIRFWAAAR